MTEKQFTVAQGPITYWTNAGQGKPGPALVFLPGLTADHRLFEQQLQAFVGQHTVLTWDPPGHGLSWPFELDFSLMDKAGWLADILQKEGIERPVIVGQSMGGYVGQAFLQRFPGRLAGFISIDSAPLQRRYITGAELWLLQRMEPVYRLYPWRALVRSGVRSCACSPYGRQLMKRMLVVYQGDQNRYARLAGHGFRMLAQAIRADLPYVIDCPALLLCGSRDRAGSTRRYNRRWHQLSGLPLLWIPKAGHNSNTDQPELVNRLIRRFLQSLS